VQTETPITELPGMATFATFEDLDGLVIGLVLGPGDPGRAAARNGAAPAAATPPGAGQAVPGPSAGAGAPVDWFEVLGADPDRAGRFYAEIFGWQTSQSGPGYRLADTGSDRGIRGGIGSAQHGVWVTVYARVPDVEAVLARAAELGGSREHGPATVDDHMQTGAVRDPAGNVFGVYSHVPH